MLEQTYRAGARTSTDAQDTLASLLNSLFLYSDTRHIHPYRYTLKRGLMKTQARNAHFEEVHIQRLIAYTHRIIIVLAYIICKLI
jgi:hypothetical protein